MLGYVTGVVLGMLCHGAARRGAARHCAVWCGAMRYVAQRDEKSHLVDLNHTVGPHQPRSLLKVVTIPHRPLHDHAVDITMRHLFYVSSLSHRKLACGPDQTRTRKNALSTDNVDLRVYVKSESGAARTSLAALTCYADPGCTEDTMMFYSTSAYKVKL